MITNNVLRSMLFARALPATGVMAQLPLRAFGAKKKRAGKSSGEGASDAEASAEETQAPGRTAEPAAEAAPVVNRSMSNAWSVGDIKVIESTPDNKAPSKEDTIEGRYAGVLFTSASAEAGLFKVYEDMRYISELY
jgi:hypothetical protein